MNVSDITGLPIETMLRDVCTAESYNCNPPTAVVADLCCHVRALAETLCIACRHRGEFRETLLHIAARADDYSAPCVRAHVADALGLTVTQLEQEIREE